MVRAAVSALVAGAAALAGCSQQPYFDINSEIGQSGPASPGETIYVGVTFLRSRAGDTVQLEALELVDPTLGGAEVEAMVVDLREVEGDSIGFITEDDPATAAEALAALAPIEGFTFSATDSWHPINVVTAITPQGPGQVSFSAIRLVFRVNGGATQRQEMPSSVRLCVDDPRPETCG
jgi:hypothetical protein